MAVALSTKTTSRWRIVLHGGCTSAIPNAHQQKDILHSLHSIASSAAERLEHGATAKEVVLHIVSQLEDYPLLNAGKGSALTRGGLHEVSSSSRSDFDKLPC